MEEQKITRTEETKEKKELRMTRRRERRSTKHKKLATLSSRTDLTPDLRPVWSSALKQISISKLTSFATHRGHQRLHMLSAMTMWELPNSSMISEDEIPCALLENLPCNLAGLSNFLLCNIEPSTTNQKRM